MAAAADCVVTNWRLFNDGISLLLLILLLLLLLMLLLLLLG